MIIWKSFQVILLMPKIKDVKNYFKSSLRVQALADLEMRYNLSCFIQN